MTPLQCASQLVNDQLAKLGQDLKDRADPVDIVDCNWLNSIAVHS